MAYHEVNQRLAPHRGETGIVFHNGCGGHLTSQSPFLQNGHLQATPNGVDTSCQPRRPPTNNNQVGFNEFRIGIWNKKGLLLHLFQA